MKTILIIIQREYLSRVKQRAFLISTFIAPLGMALLLFASGYISTISGSEKKVVAILDSGNILQKSPIDDQTSAHITYKYSTLTNQDMNQVRAKEVADVFIIIPPVKNLIESNAIELKYYGEKHLGFTDRKIIESAIASKLEEAKLYSLALNKQQIVNWKVHAKLDYINPADEKESSAYTNVATILGLLTGIIIYMILIFYGVSIMRGVLEEKTSRIVEVIVSSVKPFQLLLAKVIGIGLVGITQFLAWILVMMLVNVFVFPLLGLSANGGMEHLNHMPIKSIQPDDMAQIQNGLHELSKINWPLVFMSFIIYFIGGFFLYGSMFAALGTTINEDGETQSLSMLVTAPILISFFISMGIVNDPHSKLAVWASICPLSSPIVMTARIPFDPPIWQIVLSIFLLIISFIFTIWLAARIYRVGILMYGKKASAKEIVSWIFSKEM